ncbi:MAG: DHH family phosphoesterase [Mariprofundales bacterium]|nr:DHH family phosphoesterase [Mariprofundales bacterium]
MVSAVEWDAVLAKLYAAQGVVLTTHQNPDGDGIGSILALWHHLRQSGVDVYAHCIDPVPRIYRFLDGADQISSGSFTQSGVDTIVCLDCGAAGRLAQDESFFANRTLINIDHHKSNRRFGSINIVDSSYSATGVMMVDLIKVDGVELTRSMAEAVYVTIITDTGSFRHRGVDGALHRLTADLIDAGVDPEEVGQRVYSCNSHARMKLMSLALDSLYFSHHDQVAWLHVTDESYRESGADVEDTEGLIDIAASVDGVEVAIFLRPNDSGAGWKVSFRSRGRVEVGDLAGRLGGGGHPNAAGCLVAGDMESVRTQVHKQVSVALDGL